MYCRVSECTGIKVSECTYYVRTYVKCVGLLLNEWIASVEGI